MKDATGRLQIQLHRQPEGLGVEILSSRLTGASRVFLGKTLAETVRTLPSLFSVCATAQSAACVAAGEAALGILPHPRARLARLLLVDLETVREHLWRLLLDWPRFLGEGPRGPAMAQVMGACDRLRASLASQAYPFQPGAGTTNCHGGSATPQMMKVPAAVFHAKVMGPEMSSAGLALASLTEIGTRQVLGQPPDDWLADTKTALALDHWARSGDTPAARLLRLVRDQGWGALGRSSVPILPPLTLAALDAHLGSAGAAAFIAAPLWRGAPAESTPYARQLAQPLVSDLARTLGNGLLPRLAAQLVELAALLAGFPTRLAALGDLPDTTDPDQGILTEPSRDPPADPDRVTPAHPDVGRCCNQNPLPTDPDQRILTEPDQGTPTDPDRRPIAPSAADVEDDLTQALGLRTSAGTGLAQVQAARGLLVHRIAILDERLTDYRILAPTEWNFHPQGAAALGLATLPAADDETLRHLAGLFITALDPCVAYDICID